MTVFESNTQGSSSDPSTGPADAHTGRTAKSAATPSGALGDVAACRVAAAAAGAAASREAEIPAAVFAAREPTISGPAPGVPAKPAVTTTGYVRPPAKESPGIIRAHHDEEGETAAAASTVEPLFSNEGMFRKQVTDRWSWKARILGPIAGAVAALRAAGTAFGHNAGIRLSSLEASLGSVPDRVRGSSISYDFSHFGDTRVYAWIASAALAVQAALRAAGTAFGHNAGIRLSSLEASLGSVPDRVRGSSISYDFSHFGDTRVYAWIASAALTVRVGAVWIGSALVVVFLTVVLGLGRLVSPPANAPSGLLQGSGSGSPDSDEYGSPRKKRRVSPFWFVFASCCVLLVLIIGTDCILIAATPASSHAPGYVGTTPTLYLAGGGSGSPTSAVPASAGPSSSTGGGVTGKGSPSEGTSSTPTGAPTPTPGTTPKPTPVPIPVHRSTPVITPRRTATPVPTPTPTPVMFATIVQATPPTKHGSDATFVVQSLPTATCTLTATRTGPGGTHYTLNNVTIGGNGSSVPILWGRAWAKGTYHVTARCRMPQPDNRSITSAAVPITMP